MRYIGLLAWMIALSLMADMTWIWWVLLGWTILVFAVMMCYRIYDHNKSQKIAYEYKVEHRLREFDNLYYDGELAYYDETEKCEQGEHKSVIFKDGQGSFIRKMYYTNVLFDLRDKNRGKEIRKPRKKH